MEDVYIDFKNEQAPAINDTTLDQLQKLIKQEILQKLQLTFPIGSTYVTQENTNPNTILGFGIWERLKGRVTVGLDENDEDGYFDEIGKEGGEKKHTQTVDELVKHSHLTRAAAVGSASSFGDGFVGLTNSYTQDANFSTAQTGGGQPMNVTQPYRVVGYMWIRTA